MGGQRPSGEVRGSQAELTFSPEEELQLLARAGPRAGRAGPTASPPPFLPPLNFPFPPFSFFFFFFFPPKPPTKLLCSDEPDDRAREHLRNI